MIGLFDFTTLHNEEFRNRVLDIYSQILEKNAFVEGEYNAKFEAEFAKIQGSKHCLLVANGTDALEIALLVHGIKPGDKVGVPGITFYATGEAVLNVGAIPVLVDVLPTGLMCPASAERMIKEHELKAIMPVHIYGMPADIPAINKIAKAHNIPVIEDAAQACGAFIEGKPIGCQGNLATFSFYPTKNLSAFGDAGGILTDDDELAEKIKIIRNHGRGSDGKIMGRNSRCDHLQAVVLALKLEKIEEHNKARKEVAKKYHAALKGNKNFALVPDEYLETSAFHLYPINVCQRDIRDKLIKHLQDNQIGCANFYDRSLSQEPAFSQCAGEKEMAEMVSGAVVCLPMNPFLKDEEIKKVTDTVLGFFS
jgi:dTDP-4-amino-4,6-dideoxygalactose transaminase